MILFLEISHIFPHIYATDARVLCLTQRKEEKSTTKEVYEKKRNAIQPHTETTSG